MVLPNTHPNLALGDRLELESGRGLMHDNWLGPKINNRDLFSFFGFPNGITNKDSGHKEG
eukprot:4000352-Karenia_brevis.AAC.1